MELGVEVPRKGAVVLVTDHLIVGAHLGLGSQLHRMERLLGVQQFEDLNGHLLLQCLGRQNEDALVMLESVAQGWEQGGRRLADAGGGLNQEVIPLADTALDGIANLFLAGTHLGVRKFQP